MRRSHGCFGSSRPRCGWLAVALCLLAFVCMSASGHADDLPFRAVRARVAILDLDFLGAGKILEGGGDAADVVVERARLAIYRGDCDGAVEFLDRPDLRDDERVAELEAIAVGCARATAATLVRRDPRGVVVRFQDSSDEALFPLLVDSALAIRDTLARELGTRLPDPIFIDLVRDQLSLSALSGLPERAAQTTGTVAVAKWGRVLLLSPRATPHGYGWLDTLAHEMTHLVLSQATRDRAPLWLQEGVAKRQEIRWRPRHPFDGIPSSDDVAHAGIERGLGLPLDGLGPSIAMLPSADQAMVAFAEVSSFVAYWVEQMGESALPKLLAALRDAPASAKPEEAFQTVSGASLAEWDGRWRAWLASTPRALPEELMGGRELPTGVVTSYREVARRRRLGELLLGRGHVAAAKHVVARASKLLPTDAAVRCLHAEALLAERDEEGARALVGAPGDIRTPTPRWWSLHARLAGDGALPNARALAVGGAPYEAPIACDELPDGALPIEPVRRELCLAARRRPFP
ncbi:MAG: hypothetical protein FJ095_14350 [Deltaproteobacteria bacterium]|nr:hypothetical protein [Deltaproteobacteria bacterium]